MWTVNPRHIFYNAYQPTNWCRAVMCDDSNIDSDLPTDANPEVSKETSPSERSTYGFTERVQFIVDTPRITLQVPELMESYAAKHGALYDKVEKQWYVLVEVPETLESFGPPPVPRSPAYEYVPPCPKCGATMVKRYRNRDGDPFWGCSRYPTCKAIKEWAPPHLATPSTVILSLTETPCVKKMPPPLALRLHLRKEWERLAAELFAKIDSGAAKTWLFTPHPDLQEKTPAETMLTLEGVSKVEQLILALP